MAAHGACMLSLPAATPRTSLQGGQTEAAEVLGSPDLGSSSSPPELRTRRLQAHTHRSTRLEASGGAAPDQSSSAAAAAARDLGRDGVGAEGRSRPRVVAHRCGLNQARLELDCITPSPSSPSPSRLLARSRTRAAAAGREQRTRRQNGPSVGFSFLTKFYKSYYYLSGNSLKFPKGYIVA